MAVVSIQEAARRLGGSQDTIRRRIRRGALQAHQVPTPQGFRWAVELPDPPEADQAEPMPPQGQDVGAAQEVEDSRRVGGEAQALRELVDTLQSQVEGQREELEARRREVQELHVLLQQHVQQRALPPPGVPSWWRRLWPW
jgi:excisionase family DNA binding protein